MLKGAKIIRFPNAKAAVGPMLPKKSSVDTLSNQALCKLRDEIVAELKGRAESLQREIDQLVGPTSAANTEHRCGPRKGHKVAPKRAKWRKVVGKRKETRWLTAAMSEGKQLDDFLIGKKRRRQRVTILQKRLAQLPQQN